MNGRANANISAHFNLEDAINLSLNKIVAEASIEYDNLDVLYNDSIAIKDTKGALNIAIPSPHTNRHFKELAQLTLNSSNLQANLKTSESNSQFSTHNSQLTTFLYPSVSSL